MRRVAIACVVVCCFALAACKREEPLARVVSERAPLLSAPSGDGHAAALHRGDLVRLVGPALPRLDWRGPVDGQTETRDGELVEVRRSGDDAPRYTWRSDLAPPANVRRADAVCEAMQEVSKACPDRLRRAQLPDGALVAWEPCGDGACHFSLLRDGVVSTTWIRDLRDVRLIELAGRPVALATFAWTRAPGWTGTTVEVIRLDGPSLRRALEIQLTDEDHRSAPYVEREGYLEIDGGELRVRGERLLKMPSGSVTARTPFEERYALAK